LPGDERGSVAVTAHRSFDERQGGCPEARNRGDVLALLETGQIGHRGWNEGLGPAERLHADGENDGLPGSLGLVHEPIELVVAFLVDLVPVRAEPDHPKMQRLEALECAAIVEAKRAGAHRTEAGPYLHRRRDAMGLHGRRHEQMKWCDGKERYEQHDRQHLHPPLTYQRLDPG